ncbi:glucosaminidase domain-containing protein [Enterococcus faecalis]
MGECLTRSSRHLKKMKKKSRNYQRAAVIAGVSLTTGPLALGIVPQQVQAESSQQAFVNEIATAAASVANANDMYASVMIAQALLESSYGTSALASAPNYNLFGVKGSYNGQTVYMPTAEYLNGQWVTMTEPFRQYNSYEESFQDHANVIRSTISSNGNYHYAGVWKSNTTSYLDATAALAGRYATDPGYAGKLNWLIAAYNLTQYDWGSASQGQTNTATATGAATSTSTATTSSSTYTVVSGDTLWDIANRYGTSVEKLMATNGLTEELITVGQTLQIA